MDYLVSHRYNRGK